MTKAKILSMLLLMGSFASADPADVNLTKASLNANFNKMIDAGNLDRARIQKDIDQQISQSSASDSSDQSKVMDFVDVEVGLGENPGSVVDRRFDSVGAPLAFGSIDLRALVPNYSGRGT